MGDGTLPQGHRGQTGVTVLDLAHRREGPEPFLPASKLRPGLVGDPRVSPLLRGLLEPRAGSLVLVHAAAGYGKTVALAATQKPGWLWYNLDHGDRDPLALAYRLGAILGVELPAPELGPRAEVLALGLAAGLHGRSLTITFDRGEQLGDAPEVGTLLSELLVQLSTLSLRLATRTRPALPLERLGLEGRLVPVGPGELRLDRDEITDLLVEAWGREPRAAEIEFADSVLAGWPAALQLWLAGSDGGGDPAASLQPGDPLHQYVQHEVLEGTLGREVLQQVRDSTTWLVGTGPLWERASTPERRRMIEPIVRDRAGVVPGPGGWHLHPLVESLLGMDAPPSLEQTDPETDAASPAPPAPGGCPVIIQAFGGLSVVVDEVTIPAQSWPTASRRLLELLLSLPGHQVTAQEAGRLLWPAHLSRAGINSFNVALHGLRRMLEPGLTAGAESRYVVRMGPVYRLRLDDVACDVEDFSRLARQVPRPLPDEAARHLEAAIELYRGDFLATSVDEFVLERRARLRSVMLDTLERLGEWQAATGRSARALHAFGRILELAPQREHVWARVLELHLAAGDEYRALAALHQCEQSLDAAGIEPSDFLQDLRRRIRQGGARR
jgi:DNA-binding SARP family transcriptional activator